MELIFGIILGLALASSGNLVSGQSYTRKPEHTQGKFWARLIETHDVKLRVALRPISALFLKGYLVKRMRLSGMRTPGSQLGVPGPKIVNRKCNRNGK